MTKCSIIPATQTLAEAFYGNVPMFSMRGYVVVKDDIPIGMFGIYIYQDKVIAFSQMKDEMRKLKKEIVRTIKFFIGFLHSMNTPIYAVASKQEITSLSLLPRLGFEYVGKFSGDDVFVLGANHG